MGGSLPFALALVVAGSADEGWFLEDMALFAAGFFVEAIVAARFRLGALRLPLYLTRGIMCASVSSRIVSGRLPHLISLL